MTLSRLSLHKHIRRLKDPRINRRKRHLLGDILTMSAPAPPGLLPGDAEAAAGQCKLPRRFPCGSLRLSLGTDAALPSFAASVAHRKGSDRQGLRTEKES